MATPTLKLAAPPGVRADDLGDEKYPQLLKRAVQGLAQMTGQQPEVRHIGVAGMGPLGLGLAAVLRYVGRHSVIGWDTHPSAVGKHLMDSGLQELLSDGPIPLANGLGHFMEHADLIFLTPPSAMVGGVVRWYLNQTLSDILELAAQRPTRAYQLINCCPCRPGTTRELASWSRRPANVDIGYHPIRAASVSLSDDLQNPDSLFLGADTRSLLQAFEQTWRPIINTVPIHYVTVGEAEVLGHHYYKVNGWRFE